MFERAPVRVAGRGTGDHRSMASGLQSPPPTQLARPPDPVRVRQSMSGGTDHRRSSLLSFKTVSLWDQRHIPGVLRYVRSESGASCVHPTQKGLHHILAPWRSRCRWHSRWIARHRTINPCSINFDAIVTTQVKRRIPISRNDEHMINVFPREVAFNTVLPRWRFPN